MTLKEERFSSCRAASASSYQSKKQCPIGHILGVSLAIGCLSLIAGCTSSLNFNVVWPATPRTPKSEMIRLVYGDGRVEGDTNYLFIRVKNGDYNIRVLGEGVYVLPGHYTIEYWERYQKVIIGHVRAGDRVPGSESYDSRGREHFFYYTEDGTGYRAVSGQEFKHSEEIDLNPSQAGTTVALDWKPHQK